MRKRDRFNNMPASILYTVQVKQLRGKSDAFVCGQIPRTCLLQMFVGYPADVTAWSSDSVWTFYLLRSQMNYVLIFWHINVVDFSLKLRIKLHFF